MLLALGDAVRVVVADAVGVLLAAVVWVGVTDGAGDMVDVVVSVGVGLASTGVLVGGAVDVGVPLPATVSWQLTTSVCPVI